MQHIGHIFKRNLKQTSLIVTVIEHSLLTAIELPTKSPLEEAHNRPASIYGGFPFMEDEGKSICTIGIFICQSVSSNTTY